MTRNIQGQYKQSQPDQPVSVRRLHKVTDFTNNAKNISRYSDEESNSKPQVTDGHMHIFEPVAPDKVTSLEKYTNNTAENLGNRAKSLTRVNSLETPLGVVRQISSPTLDSMYSYSGTSQDSLRHEIGSHKINTMPIQEEDESSKEATQDIIDDEKSKTKDKSKIKRRSFQRSVALQEEMVEISLGNENEAANEVKNTSFHSKEKQQNGKFQRLFDCVKRIIPCTRSRNDLDPDKLLDINSCPREV